MKEVSIYDFNSYKLYIKSWIAARPSKGRGEKRRIAEQAGCYSAYISQVLEHQAHFTLEQAAALNSHFGHGQLESRFFLLLVQRERAGTSVLRENVEKQIAEILEHRISLRHRLENKGELNLEDQARYYSSWHYAAAHVAVSLPQCGSREDVARMLNIPLSKATEVLDFLVAKNLIEQEKNRFNFGPTQLFLPQSSPLCARMHSNWRMRAIDSLDRETPQDLHFSSVATIRTRDLAKVRNIFMKAIEDVNKLVHEGEHEDAVFFVHSRCFPSVAACSLS